jgi:hypothetical protein
MTQKITEEEVWLRAWVAVAASSNCVSKDSADRWADHCLEQFKKRFGKIK